MKKRIVYKPDGQVVIIHPIMKTRKEGEPIEAFYQRVFDKAMQGDLTGMEYDDVEETALPTDRSLRDKWRGRKGQGIHVDHSIKTETEKRQELESVLDAELEKTSPDPVAVMRMQRKLQKKDY